MDTAVLHKGRLVVQRSNLFIHDVPQQHWEGQFVEISGGGLTKYVIICNICRPPRDLNADYRQFTDEFATLLQTLFYGSNNEVIIAGDFDLNLPKTNEK